MRTRYRAEHGLGTTDIARICHVTPPTVGRWIEEGRLPSFRTAGGHRRVWAGDLVGFLRGHNIPVPPDLEGYGRRRVLVVDDEPAARAIIARVVLQLDPGAEIHEAEDGFTAGHKTAALLPALVVLDIGLPRMDGLQVCRLIRSEPALRRVRVLAISGLELAATRSACLQAGADAFLPKPFDLEALKGEIRRLLPAPAVREAAG